MDSIAVVPDSATLLDGLRQRARRRNSLAQELEIQRRTPAAVAKELQRLKEDARRRSGSSPGDLMEGDAVVGAGILAEPTDDDVISRSVPSGIRTRVAGVKGRYPGPLDDGD